MTLEIGIVYLIVLLMLAIPMLGRWRYDLVALMGLLVLAILGIVSPEEAFSGFGHPAVITVAAVLVVSRGLQNSGVVDVLARWISGIGDHISLQLIALCGLAALASAFMNNVGALAVFLPVAIRLAYRSDRSPALLLMPLAFAAHFGGMMTLIGTPSNVIVAAFREQYVGEPFRMFDFAPLGIVIAVASIAFIALVGWRLIPNRKRRLRGGEALDIGAYLSEVRVLPGSPLANKQVRMMRSVTGADVLIVGVVRDSERHPAPSGFDLLLPGDVLIVRAGVEDLEEFIQEAEIELAESKPLGEASLETEEVRLVEVVVAPDSMLIGKTARSLNLRWRYGVNLLAASRRGTWLRSQLAEIRFRTGDVLLLQGRHDTLTETLQQLGCLPLVVRKLRLIPSRNVYLSTGIFAAAMVVAALGILPIQVAMSLAACGVVLTGLVSLPDAYQSINWPIIVLLGTVIPVGIAMERTGGAQLIADQILIVSQYLSPAITLALFFLTTMFLSDLVNNAVAVVLMSPIALAVAQGLGISVDPFLVAVAIGGSCAFLTPIGHQSNILVLEPGGYEFGDYWRLGLPIELIIVAVGVPLLLVLWPF